MLLRAGVLCNDTTLSGKDILGDPTEVALTEFAANHGFSKRTLDKENERLNEIPFDSDRKLMSVLTTDTSGQKVMWTKGAVDKLLDRCSKVMLSGKVIELNEDEKKKILDANTKMSNKALRVLAFACKNIDGNNEFKEDNLIFIGLMGMIDPPRKEIKKAVEKCKRAGMKPIMITGDHSQTAFAIAHEIGIASDVSQVITGLSMSKMSDEEFFENIEKYSVFARVSPEDKVRIVDALKRKGHVVSMTGDGVNDAPSLKKASIGIGMGITGTDVAKEVSDIIIADDNFATIVVAVEEGRKIYRNIQKTVKFLFSANLAELLSLFIVTMIYPAFVFLFPVQILFVNLITDSLPAIALGVENPEKNLMEVPPRDSKKGLFSNGIGISIIVLGLFQTLFVIASYIIGVSLFNEQVATTMAFYTLNLVQMFYLTSMRTDANIFKSKPHKNKLFLLAISFCLALTLLFALTPVGSVLRLVGLTWMQWGVVIGLSFAMLVVSEIYKIIERKVMNKKYNIQK